MQLGILDVNGNRGLKVSLTTRGGIIENSYAFFNEDSGQNVQNSIQKINEKISKELEGLSIINQTLIDNKMINLDGTLEKSNYGKETILAVSKAVCRACAKSIKIPLYLYLGGISGRIIPNPVLKFDDKYLALKNNDISSFFEKILKLKNSYDKFKRKESYDKEEILYGDIKSITGFNENIFVNPYKLGTITETINYIKNSKMNGKMPILQCEDEGIVDTFFADLSIGLNLKFIDFGMPDQCLNTVKYNRIIEIEEQLM